MPAGGQVGRRALIPFVVAESPAALECLTGEPTPVFSLGQRIRQSLEQAHSIRAHAAAPESVQPYARATTTTIQ
jgi:hypothetical protein